MKQYILDYYEGTRQYYGTYHNHKEVSAWGGLALHILFCGLILAVDTPPKHKIMGTVGFAVMILLVAFFVVLFVRNQLAMKDRASALAGAAMHLLAEILMKDDSELNPEEYLKIAESTDRQAQSSHVLPKRLLDEADIINTRGRGYQDRTKLMIYTILLLSTISTIGFKFMGAWGLTTSCA